MSDSNLKYLTVEDAKKITRMSIDSIRKNIRNGELKASKVGVRYLIDEKDLSSFIQSRVKKVNSK